MEHHPVFGWVTQNTYNAIYCSVGVNTQRHPLQVLNHRLSHITRNVLVDIIVAKRRAASQAEQDGFDREALRKWRDALKTGVGSYLDSIDSIPQEDKLKIKRDLTSDMTFKTLGGINIPPAQEDVYGVADPTPFGPFRIDLIGQLKHGDEQIVVPAEHHPESYIQSPQTVARDARLLIHMAWQAVRTPRRVTPHLHVVRWTAADGNSYSTICRAKSNTSRNWFGFTLRNDPGLNSVVDFDFGDMGSVDVGKFGYGGDDPDRKWYAMSVRIEGAEMANGQLRVDSLFERTRRYLGQETISETDILETGEGTFAGCQLFGVPSQYSRMRCVRRNGVTGSRWVVETATDTPRGGNTSRGSIVCELMEQPVWPDSTVDTDMHVAMKQFTPFHRTNVVDAESDAINDVLGHADFDKTDLFILHRDVEQQLNPIGEQYPVLEFGADPNYWCCGRHALDAATAFSLAGGMLCQMQAGANNGA